MEKTLRLFLNTNGKSGFLLNTVLWAAKYSDFKCNDQSKKPLILYISQENDLNETVDRIISYSNGVDNNKQVLNDSEEVYKLVTKELMNDNCNIRLLYRPKNSITTADVETILNDIEAEGEFEVKLVVHDYLKRIKPEISYNDLRIDLGEAVNDFSILAKLKKIPIITANQMNREAYKALEAGLEEDAQNKEKKDLAKRLSLNMQSESSMISENADSIIAIHREYAKSLDKWFLTVKDLKMRGSKGNRDSSSTYFAHPFEKDNSMRLIEDVNLEKSHSVVDISMALSGFNKENNVPNQIIEEELDATSMFE